MNESGNRPGNQLKEVLHYADLFHAIGHPVLIIDPKHMIIDANRAAIIATGLTAEEIKCRKCYEVFHSRESKNPPLGCPLEKLLATGKQETIEMEIEALHGYYLVSCTPVVDSSGRLDKIIHIATDITEVKKAADALKKSEELKSSILSSIPHAVIGLQERVINFCNEGVEAVFGWKHHELIGKNTRILYRSDEEYEEIGKRFYSVLEKQRIHSEECICRHKDGKDIICMGIASVIGESLREKRIIVIYQDITERKLADNLIKKNEEKFRQLIDRNPVAMAVADKDGKFLFFNNKFIKTFGYTIEDIPSVYEWWPLAYPEEEYRAKVIHSWRAAASKAIRHHKETESREWRVTCKDGSLRDIEFRMSSMEDENIVIFHDITEQKKLEQQLLHSQKMEAIGQLAGGVAHDFNNIISAVMGFSTLIQMRTSADDPSMEYINEILAATNRAANLTQNLLAFSRKQPITIKPFSLNQTLSAVGKLLLNFLGEDIHLDFRLSEKDIVIMGDSGQIDQVMMNLATNARDSMPDGGTLTVSTQLTDIDNEFKRMHGYGEAGTYALISVEDTGMGMDDETKQRIFEPFFTTKEVGRGTGLGLAIIYGIVKQHNGYIDVYSELGRGTTFRIYLPAIDLKAEEALSSEYIPLIGGTETILLVEDERALRTVTKTMLEKYGYRVIAAEDGIDAVQKFTEHKDTINLILMDVIMPNKNGKEAYQDILAIRPDTQVIFLSGYTSDIITKKILDEGWELLLKPVSPRALFRKIRGILETGKSTY
jgi:two-component system NtrC family sensor kinase